MLLRGAMKLEHVTIFEDSSNFIEKALALGCSDLEAIRYLLLESRLDRPRPEALYLPELMEYNRPLPSCCDYDRLLGVAEVRA